MCQVVISVHKKKAEEGDRDEIGVGKRWSWIGGQVCLPVEFMFVPTCPSLLLVLFWWWFPGTSEATWTLTFYFLLWRWQFSVSGWWHCIPSVQKTFLLHSLLSAARSCLLRLSGFPNTFNLDAESILPAWTQALALRRPDCPRGGSLWLLARRNSVPLFSLLPKSDVMGSSLGSLNFYFLIFSIQ